MQHRIRMAKDMDEACEEESNEMPDIPSTIPFLPHIVSLIYNVVNRLKFAPYRHPQTSWEIWIVS
mgnify:CR=1 FL=1